LPKNLVKLQQRGLEIKIVGGTDLRSHKKYFYAMQEYKKSIIITVDDDFIYPLNLIEKLYQNHIRYPNNIIANRAISKTYVNNVLQSYIKWETIKGEKGPSKDIFFTSGGGTLF